jgi:ankyrin repeat protein
MEETEQRIKELQSAVESGEISLISTLTNDEIDNLCLLHLACEARQPETVELLLKMGASIHQPGKESPFPVECAASRGSIEILRILLDHGAPINPVKNLRSGYFSPYSPLLRAIDHNNFETTKFLLENGADQNFRIHPSTDAPLHNAVEKNNEQIVSLLLEYKPDFKWLKTKQAISLAAKNGNLAILERLLIASKINQKSVKGFYSAHGLRSPLEEAVLANNLGSVKMLMKYGANPHASTSGMTWESSPIAFAIRKGYVEILNYLLENGGRFVTDAKEMDWDTPDAFHVYQKGVLIEKAERSGNADMIERMKQIEDTLFGHTE